MSNKGKKDQDFHVGSLVFAKLKGFAPWPAKVVKAEKKKYYVYFYGTGEKSPAMKSEDLFDYSKYKNQYVVDKNMKRKFYPEAVEQIETALRGEEDVASINNSSAANDSLEYIEESEVADEKGQVDESETVSQQDDNTTSNSKTEATSDSAAAEVTETPVATPTKEVKPPKKSVTKVAKVAPVPEPKQQKVSEVPTETPEPEITSRSGRKIKSKRYLIDELEETVTPVIKKRLVETSIDERKSIDLTNEASPKKVKRSVVELKEIPNPEKDMLLQTENHLLELDYLIKASVGLKNANADKCLEHLNEYKTLKITPLMLKKRPGVVQTMKRLRKYVGNANNWEMDDSMKHEFKEKANKIQLKANEIYSSFKLLFPHHEQKTFWDHFSEKVEEFQTKIKGMSLEELNNLYIEPPTPPTSPVQQPENNGGVSLD